MAIRLRSTTKFSVAAFLAGVAPWLAIFVARHPEPIELPPAVRAEATRRLAERYGEDKSATLVQFFESEASQANRLLDAVPDDLLHNPRCPVPLPGEDFDSALYDAEVIEPFLKTMAGGFASQADPNFAKSFLSRGWGVGTPLTRYMKLCRVAAAIRCTALHRGDLPAAVEALRKEAAVADTIPGPLMGWYRFRIDAGAVNFAVRQRPVPEDCILLERAVEELFSESRYDDSNHALLLAIETFDRYRGGGYAWREFGDVDGTDAVTAIGAMNLLALSTAGATPATSWPYDGVTALGLTIRSSFMPWTRVAAVKRMAQSRLSENPALANDAAIPLELLPEEWKTLGFLAVSRKNAFLTPWSALGFRWQRTQILAARIALAARRHRAEFGTWPDSIDALRDSLGPFDSAEMRFRNRLNEINANNESVPEVPYGPFAIRDISPTIEDVPALLGMTMNHLQSSQGYRYSVSPTREEDGRLHVEMQDYSWLRFGSDYRDVLSWLRRTVPEWIDSADLVDETGRVLDVPADSPDASALAGRQLVKLRVRLSIPRTVRCVVLERLPEEVADAARSQSLFRAPRMLMPLLDEIPKPAN